MNPSNSVRMLRIPFATALALALLAGCHPHAEHGTFDEKNAITVVEVAKLGLVEAKKRYEGKIVTFKGPLEPTGVAGMNAAKPNTCIQGFGKRLLDVPTKYPSTVPGTNYQDAGLYVYFNFGDEAGDWMKDGSFEQANVHVEHPLILEEDVCDTEHVCSEGDLAGARRCKFSSDRFLIAGQVVGIHEEGGGAGIKIQLRPTGLRY